MFNISTQTFQNLNSESKLSSSESQTQDDGSNTKCPLYKSTYITQCVQVNIASFIPHIEHTSLECSISTNIFESKTKQTVTMHTNQHITSYSFGDHKLKPPLLKSQLQHVKFTNLKSKPSAQSGDHIFKLSISI